MKISTAAGRQNDVQTSRSKFPRSLYTSEKAYGNLVLQTTLPRANRPLYAAIVLFLENVFPLQI